MTEPLPPYPFNRAGVTPEDGEQNVSQDPGAAYESEVDDDGDA
ncbi:hypothetical protein FHR32_005142 [Streptosporangium album]|uniref:Uncharacterized protein n=1 Tax=Streptosporangium album TaxID=47479 RepID=A0A7W7RYU6_9ACTN|nr:hypothetical protein [Streptosporangium album]MBB4940765.1 hypothetical protein [Streptosporangium album]